MMDVEGQRGSRRGAADWVQPWWVGWNSKWLLSEGSYLEEMDEESLGQQPLDRKSVV